MIPGTASDSASDASTASVAASVHDDDSPCIDQLRTILENQDHLFACSGSIPIIEKPKISELAQSSPHSESDEDEIQSDEDEIQSDEDEIQSDEDEIVDESRTSDPVTIRWDVDPGDDDSNKRASQCARITLPLASGSEPDLQRLVEESQPATFGRGGEDVYDETYRKALKMDTTAFCSTFDPYSLGIIDIVAQVLLPSIIDSSTHRAVQAELYKLNVYTGPSGRFKAHVDTPRSPSQFGSLVVCLPLAHEGGHLKVRHKNKEITYDWSTSRDKPDHATIRWAAFYSDCEHEILEVTSGHRLTLTYNLYAVRGTGRLTGVCPTLEPTQLPLYQAIEAAVNCDPFDGKRGALGFWCSHAYAYNHHSEAIFPDTLKGVDAIIWEVLCKLGLTPAIAPIVENEGQRGWRLRDKYERKHPRPPKEDVKGRELWEAMRPALLVAGKRFGISINYDEINVEMDYEYEGMLTEWGYYLDGRVKWLTTPGVPDQLQLAYTAYGNQALTETMYSNCAILVDIPKPTRAADGESLGVVTREAEGSNKRKREED